MPARPLDVQIAELLDEPVRKGSWDKDAPEMRELLCRWLARGKTLWSWCRQKGTPTAHTVYKWLERDPQFANEVATAKAIGYDMIAQECLAIADQGDDSDVKHRSLRIATRLKLLARWDGTRYGAKLQVGGDPSNPTPINVRLSDEEVMREVMRILAMAKQRQLADVTNRVSGAAALLN